MVKEDTLFQIFGRIHNHIYANEGLSPQEAFNEFIKILFIKLDSERNNSLSLDFKISNQEYESIINGNESNFSKRLEKIFNNVKKDYPEIFNIHDKLNLKESTLGFVVKELQGIDFRKFHSDVKGAAFQKFIFSSLRGSRGQFLTPDPIINLAINFLKPSKKEKIIDPACGTGGFLINAMNYIKLNSRDLSEKENKNICGIEISSSVLRLARIRMIIEGDGNSNLINGDSLKDFNEITNLKLENEFDLVFTNPPFGSQGKITDKNYLKRFDLSHVWDKKFNLTNKIQGSQTPEILFIERCMNLLKEGGKLAIVLPDGILENKTTSYIREYLKRNGKIIAVVSLPNQTFIPHGTGVKTSVLFWEKTKNHARDYSIFFSVIENVGYNGNKNASLTYKIDKDGNKILNEDISEAIKLFHEFEKNNLSSNTELGFSRKFSEIEDRLDAEFYSPIYKKLELELKKRGAIPLGELVEIKSKKADIMKNPKATINYLEITNINPTTSEIVSSQEMKVKDAPSRASYEVREGEIITAVAGISTGTLKHSTAMVAKESDGFICTNGFRVLIPKKIDKNYLFFFLRSEIFLSQMRRYRIGAAIPSVIESDLKKILVPIPEKKIMEDISKKVNEALEMRNKAREKIEALRELSFLR
jgi:type I restriction enzyme M protein